MSHVVPDVCTESGSVKRLKTAADEHAGLFVQYGMLTLMLLGYCCDNFERRVAYDADLYTHREVFNLTCTQCVPVSACSCSYARMHGDASEEKREYSRIS